MCTAFHHIFNLKTIYYIFAIIIYIPTQVNTLDYASCKHYYDKQPTHLSQIDFEAKNCPRNNESNPHANNTQSFLAIKIAYLDYPPYIFAGSNSSDPSGIFPALVTDWIEKSCGLAERKTITWVKTGFKNPNDLEDYCRNNALQCHMSIPSMGVKSTEGGNGVVRYNNFAMFYRSIGDVFVTVRGEVWRSALTNFGQSIVNIWPFMVVCLIFALLSGAVVWILDTWSNAEDFPRAFIPGVYQGFWWSFVSMTTVGYGDKAPKSVLGRFFSIIWIIVGILMISALTSICGNALSNSVVIPETVIRDQQVGYVVGSNSAKDVISMENGVPVEAKDIIELENWLARGLIKGFVMDKFVLQLYWKERLSKLKGINYILERKFNNVGKKHFGISFYNMPNHNDPTKKPDPAEWRTCMEEFMLHNIHNIDFYERHYREVVLQSLGAQLFEPSRPKPLDLFDPHSDYYKDLMWALIGIAASFLVIGLLYDLMRVVFFGTSTFSLRDKFGSWNAGYNASGDGISSNNTISSDKKMTKEEKQMQELVEKVVSSIETKMRETERDTKNEIREMVRVLRRQMADMKKRQEKDYGL